MASGHRTMILGNSICVRHQCLTLHTGNDATNSKHSCVPMKKNVSSNARRARANIESARNPSALYACEESGEKHFLSRAGRRQYETRLDAEVQRYCR